MSLRLSLAGWAVGLVPASDRSGGAPSRSGGARSQSCGSPPQSGGSPSRSGGFPFRSGALRQLRSPLRTGPASLHPETAALRTGRKSRRPPREPLRTGPAPFRPAPEPLRTGPARSGYRRQRSIPVRLPAVRVGRLSGPVRRLAVRGRSRSGRRRLSPQVLWPVGGTQRFAFSTSAITSRTSSTMAASRWAASRCRGATARAPAGFSTSGGGSSGWVKRRS
jgi:hypothetical protein